MQKPEKIDISVYDYNLSDDRIAKRPLPARDQSLLLHYKDGDIGHRQFADLPELLEKEDLLIFNDTRVIQARLQFRKETGAEIELFCLEPVEPAEYQVAFEQRTSCKWRCMVGNAKKWKQGDLKKEISSGSESVVLRARMVEKENGTYIIDFSWNNRNISFAEIIENVGLTPIPPYLNRSSDSTDKLRYQTVYSRYNGSVAAPTAGLHFANSLFRKLERKGVLMENLTLHVGAGTFTPVKEKNATRHVMHSETVLAERAFIKKLRDHKGRIIAVGTTSMRSLESLYWLGIKVAESKTEPGRVVLSQWESYDKKNSLSVNESLDSLISFMDAHNMGLLQFRTQIMIVPGYTFRLVNGLITNFHQPKSTLLLLVGAFIGEKWRDVYEYAMKNDFRFLSYGDGSILFP